MLSTQCAHTAPHTRSSLRTPGPAPPPARPRSPAPASRCGVFLEELPAFLLRMLHFCWPISFLLAVADGAALATKNAPLRSRALTHTPGTAGSGLGGLSVSKGRARGPFTDVSFRSHVDGPRGERLRFPVPLFHHAWPPFPSAPHGPERLHRHQPSHLYSCQSEGRKGKTRCASF